MYCTPCARLMKFMTPKTSVSPAAMRNRRMPSCSPLSTCTMNSVVFMATPSRRGATLVPPHPEEPPKAVSKEGRPGPRPSRRPLRGLLRMRNVAHSLRNRKSSNSFHRAVLGVRVGIVLEDLLVDLGLELAVGTLGDLHQIEILDRIMVGVEAEA